MSGRGEQVITGVSTDSRTIQPGELFFALEGERFDGHDFVTAVWEKNAGGAVVAREVPSVGDRVLIRVADTLRALQDWAAAYRRSFDLPVIGVTGSAGKTTTKDMVAAVCGVLGDVLKNQGNFNNEIGLPLTLLGLARHHRAAVLEMGMRGPGEIADLCCIARPQIGVITVIGPAHLERLGSVANIAQAKGELLESLPADGWAVLNSDDPWAGFLADRTRARRLFYGFQPGAQVRAVECRAAEERGMTFRVEATGEAEKFFIPWPGRHHVSDALAAIAVGWVLGLHLADMAPRLRDVSLSAMRGQELAGINGSLLINDTYNANPPAVQAALEALAAAWGRRKIAVLGDMLELGEAAPAAHQEAGHLASRLGIDVLVAVGELARHTAIGARKSWPRPAEVQWFATPADALPWLREQLRPGDVALFKASRAVRLEFLVQKLTEAEA